MNQRLPNNNEPLLDLPVLCHCRLPVPPSAPLVSPTMGRFAADLRNGSPPFDSRAPCSEETMDSKVGMWYSKCKSASPNWILKYARLVDTSLATMARASAYSAA